MFDYLQQFNNLPAALRERVSSPSAMAALSELEAKYRIELATIVMRVMVRNIPFSSLSKTLVSESSLSQAQAEVLSQEMAEKVFFGLEEYLGIGMEEPAESNLDKRLDAAIKEADIMFPSSDMQRRLRSVLLTYAKGVRSRIDARSILSRPVAEGGFALPEEKVNRLLASSAKAAPVSLSPLPAANRPASPLQKIIDAEANKLSSAMQADSYDLKASIAARAKKEEPKTPDEHKQVVVPVNQPVTASKSEEASPKSPKLLEEVPGAKMLGVPVPAGLPVVVPPISKPAMSLKKVEAAPKKTEPTIVASKPESVPAPTVKVPEQKSAATISDGIKPAPAKASVADLRSLAGRYKIQDIKPAPVVMGPVDELRMLTVTNFRRLGETPNSRIEKIVAKIRLLRADGYEKMVQGVGAWRLSPANRLYLQIAKDALVQGMTLQQAAQARAKAGKETYSLEEMEAIITLNNRLMF